MEAEAAQGSLYRALVDRFHSLEASYGRLRDQFDVVVKEQRKRRMRENGSSDSGGMTSCSGWGSVPGVFSAGSLCRNVLDNMGHAVYVSRVVSGEIIY
ncbi:hypothetical protein U1Q18_019551, partial [Sarracenia purpurea var. burkii]